MTLSSLSFVVFLDPYQGSDGICLISKYVVFVVWGIVTLPSLSSYSDKALISGAHRWEIKYTYSQDIYCIVKPWIKRNKSISQYQDVHVWRMNGVWWWWWKQWWKSNSTFCSFEGIHTVLALLKLFEENKMLYIFFFSFFSFLSGGYLVPLILLSNTCPFLPLVSLFIFLEVSGTCPFYFLVFFFFSSLSFFRALTLLE